MTHIVCIVYIHTRYIHVCKYCVSLYRAVCLCVLCNGSVDIILLYLHRVSHVKFARLHC